MRLGRADSGMPQEELTPRSESVSTASPSPPDQPGSNHSESSSGVHSNESSENPHNSVSARRATSIADLAQPISKEEPQWRCGSLQRPLPQPKFPYSYIVTKKSPAKEKAGIPVVAMRNTVDNTVVIRRTNRPPTKELAGTSEPFGRSTNMRMTSFTENSDEKMSSATLPHYPTQPITAANYPHCSTMPLPQPHTPMAGVANLGTGKSCNIYPRIHTTIPTHHNGVRLFSASPTPNPYLKRLQYQNGSCYSPVRLNVNEPIYTGINRVSGEIYHYNS